MLRLVTHRDGCRLDAAQGAAGGTVPAELQPTSKQELSHSQGQSRVRRETGRE